jgi:hypothetical protein
MADLWVVKSPEQASEGKKQVAIVPFICFLFKVIFIASRMNGFLTCRTECPGRTSRQGVCFIFKQILIITQLL